MENTRSTKKSMKTFMLIWIGQLISLIGSGLTSFALGVWIYVNTGQATPFALVALFNTLPRVLLAPIAGSIADRYNRRKIMIAADTGDALVTAAAAVLLFSGNLQIWQIYLIAAFSSIFASFQSPAYQASVTMLVPKKDLARAGGMVQIGAAIERILTPIAAGALFGLIGLEGIILIDLVTYTFAIGALVMVFIPQPEQTTDVEEAGEKKSLLKDAVFGWHYLKARKGLFGLLWYFAMVNFFLSFSGVLYGPLVLSFGSAADLGIVSSAGGFAMLLGGIIISSISGPKKRVPWVIATIAFASTGFLISGLKSSVAVIAAGQVILLFFIPFAAALSQAVFQTKVAPDVQGRVFAIRGMIASSMSPLAFTLAGPLADSVFDPLMMSNGLLGQSFVGSILGTGTGRGIGLILILACGFLWAASIYAFSNPHIRNLEAELPDAVPDDPEDASSTVPPVEEGRETIDPLPSPTAN